MVASALCVLLTRPVSTRSRVLQTVRTRPLPLPTHIYTLQVFWVFRGVCMCVCVCVCVCACVCACARGTPNCLAAHRPRYAPFTCLSSSEVAKGRGRSGTARGAEPFECSLCYTIMASFLWCVHVHLNNLVRAFLAALCTRNSSRQCPRCERSLRYTSATSSFQLFWLLFARATPHVRVRDVSAACATPSWLLFSGVCMCTSTTLSELFWLLFARATPHVSVRDVSAACATPSWLLLTKRTAHA